MNHAQRISISLNIDKQFKMAYPKERFCETFDDIWMLHKKTFSILCESYEVPSASVTKMFRMALHGSALNLFDSHFLIDQHNKNSVDHLFPAKYDSTTRKEEVSYKIKQYKD